MSTGLQLHKDKSFANLLKNQYIYLRESSVEQQYHVLFSFM